MENNEIIELSNDQILELCEIIKILSNKQFEKKILVNINNNFFVIKFNLYISNNTKNTSESKIINYFDSNLSYNVHLFMTELFVKYKMSHNIAKFLQREIMDDIESISYINYLLNHYKLHNNYEKIIEMSCIEHCSGGTLHEFLMKYNVNKYDILNIFLQAIVILLFLQLTSNNSLPVLNNFSPHNILCKIKKKPIIYNIAPNLSFKIQNPRISLALENFSYFENNTFATIDRIRLLERRDFLNQFIDVHHFFNIMTEYISKLNMDNEIQDFIKYICPDFLNHKNVIYESNLIMKNGLLCGKKEFINKYWKIYNFNEESRFPNVLIFDNIFNIFNI